MKWQERSALTSKAKIQKLYGNLAIEEGYLRTGIKSIKEADDSETDLREMSFQAVEEMLSSIDTNRFWGKLVDEIKIVDEAFPYLLKAQYRTASGDERLDALLNLAVDCIHDQELNYKCSEIVNDYFLNYASAAQKLQVVDTLTSLWTEEQEGF